MESEKVLKKKTLLQHFWAFIENVILHFFIALIWIYFLPKKLQ